jgi:hypothetical protein
MATSFQSSQIASGALLPSFLARFYCRLQVEDSGRNRAILFDAFRMDRGCEQSIGLSSYRHRFHRGDSMRRLASSAAGAQLGTILCRRGRREVIGEMGRGTGREAAYPAHRGAGGR